MIRISFFCKLTHLFFGEKVTYCQLFQDGRAPGFFPMRNRRLWEGAFAANGNRAVRPEVAMEPEVATMAIREDHKKLWNGGDEPMRSRCRHRE